MLQSLNPATGEVLRSITPHDESAVEQRLARAHKLFPEYRRTTFAQRAAWMAKAGELLDAEQQALGKLMAQEMGKTQKAGAAEAAKCAWVCRYYAENAEKHLADEELKSSATKSWVAFQPLGPVLAVMPWNFPFWQVFRFAAPALMAGNLGLLKHASNVPQCALAIEDVFRRAGFPEGAFQTLLIGSDKVAKVIADPRVAAVTLTGSVEAGRKVASAAGQNLKKSVLELGGSDPFIVMPSADLTEAARVAVQARTINNGQSCIAAKRFIVHEKVYDEFERRFVEGMKALKVGDPLDEKTDIGPLATKQIVEDLHAQVQESVQRGAKLLLGGKPIAGRGNFYAPTVLSEIPQGTPAFDQELFGPAASLFKAKDLGEAIALANATEFGLGSSAWTNDAGERRRFIEEIAAGQVFINAMVASDPRLPFGGVKSSGYGRELAAFGIREFTNIKTVYVSETKGGKLSDSE